MHASLMMACSSSLLAGSGGKEIVMLSDACISFFLWVVFLSEVLRAFAFKTDLTVRSTRFLSEFFSIENTVTYPVHFEQLCWPMKDLSDIALHRELTAMPCNVAIARTLTRGSISTIKTSGIAA